MKKLHLIFLTIAISGNIFTNAQTIIWQEDFEVDGNGSTYTVDNEFQDSTNDYFRRTNNSAINIGTSPDPDCGEYIGQSNTFYWACEDTDDSCAVASSCNTFGGTDGLDYKAINFNQINSSGFSNITFKGLFAVGSNCNSSFQYDFNDGAVISYSTDGGINYTQALKFRYDNASNSNFNQRLGLITTLDQTCLISTGNGGFSTCGNTETPASGTNISTYLSTTFQEFSFTIPGAPSMVDLKIEMSFDGQGEEFAFDNFRLEGNSTLALTDVEKNKNKLSFYPNPVSKELFIENINEEIKASIYSITGEKILDTTLYEATSIDVSFLKKGVYFLSYKKSSIKFIKK